MIILGAGQAGLLGANILGDKIDLVIEQQSCLPDNHHALLRFRSSIISDATRIPFKKVKVIKAIHPWRNPVADSMAYSEKCLGNYSMRSIIDKEGVVDRWISPPDFLQKLSRRVTNIQYNKVVDRKTLESLMSHEIPIISTLPMPVLMKLLDWPEVPKFQYTEGKILESYLDIDCDAYVTVYSPSPSIPFTRASITGNKITIECPLPNDRCAAAQSSDLEILTKAKYHLGIGGGTVGTKWYKQKYMKILPCNERIRKRFIIWATDKFGVYSLGRFATWKVGLMLDDLVQDIDHIEHIIHHENYSGRLK